MFLRIAGIALAASLVLSVPVGAHTVPTSGAGSAAGAPLLQTDQLPVPAGIPTAPLPPSTPMTLAVTLAFSNASRLARALAAVQDPSSPSYRHFLSYQEFVREYGPSAGEVLGVERVLRDDGAIALSRAPGPTTIDATLPASAVASLFGVTPVAVGGSSGTSGYSVLGTPRLPPSLQGRVLAVDGLAERTSASASLIGRGATGLSSALSAPRLGQFVQQQGTGEDWYIGTDYTQAYGATSLLPGTSSVPGAIYPRHVAVATLLASGYNVPTSTALPPWDPAVVDAYFNETFPGGWPLPALHGVGVTVPGAGSAPAPGSFGGTNDSLEFEVENSLDLEMAGSLAPGASLYNFYFNSSVLVNPVSFTPVSEYLADDLGAALSYDYAAASPASHLAVISCSFGVEDLVSGQWDADLQTAALTGVSIVAATGDQGNAPSGETGRNESVWPLWPATAAFNTSGAIAVGGVSLLLSGTPTAQYSGPPLVATYDSNVAGISRQVAWWDTDGGPGRYAGSEGGSSQAYPEPTWQFHSAAQAPIVNATELERFHALGRTEPDLALAANVTIAYVGANGAGTPYFEVLGGTSVAAPVFGGLLADVVAVENNTLAGGRTGLGFLAPELYRISSYFWAHNGAVGQDPFQDVVAGHNAMFSAARGWDPTTGWGGISAPLFLAADENLTVSNYTYTGPTPSLPPAHGPGLNEVGIILLFAGAGAVAVGATYAVVSTQRRRSAAALAPVLPGPTAPPGWDIVTPPTGVAATFLCPYCSAPRPAEPGHCPNCGAM